MKKVLFQLMAVALLPAIMTSCKKTDDTTPSSSSLTANTNALGSMSCKINGTAWQSASTDTSQSTSGTESTTTDYGLVMTITGKKYNSANKTTDNIQLSMPHWVGVGSYAIKLVTNSAIQANTVAIYTAGSATYNSNGGDTTSVVNITDYDKTKKTIKGNFHFKASGRDYSTAAIITASITEGSFYVKSNY